MEREGVTRILLVDDDRGLFEYYKMVFDGRFDGSVSLEGCLNGDQLEERLSADSYDIVILDQRLSEGERGIDLIPIIKAKSPDTRIVLNSAYGSEDLAAESLRLGVDDYVCGNKVNDDLLVDALNRVMSGIRIETRISEIIEMEKRDAIDFSRCCDEKMRRLRDRVGKMNQILSV